MGKKYGECPFCSSPNCSLSLNDFMQKNTSEKLKDNPLQHLIDRPEYKEHLKRIEKDMKLGKHK